MKIKKILLLFSVFCISIFNCQKVDNDLNIGNTNRFNVSFTDNEECVVDYVDILKSYYSLAKLESNFDEDGFKTFYEDFYSEENNKNILEFTLDFAEKNGNFDEVYNILVPEYSLTPISSSSGSGGPSSRDADYILKDSYDYSVTPETSFARIPYHCFYNYSNVENGDIVWETETIFFNAGHNALITNTKHVSYYGIYIETIEAVGGGVQRGFLDDIRMTEFKCKILRVVGKTSKNAKEAILFANMQIGKKYNLSLLRLNTAITSTEWYCSELVYASWKYAGIVIGVKKDHNDNDVYLKFCCLPADINNSYNTKPITIVHSLDLDFCSAKFKNGVLSINVVNKTNVVLDIYYNSKFCKLDEAKNWQNLNDIKRIKISPYTYTTFSVKENDENNVMATSYILGDCRYILYLVFDKNYDNFSVFKVDFKL